MENKLPGKFKIVVGLLALLGAMSIWSWIDGGMADTGDLSMGIIHVLLAVGLFLKFNAARIVTIVASFGSALIYLVSSIIFSLWGYLMHSGAEQAKSVLATKDVPSDAAQAATVTLDMIQALPWVVAIEGAVMIVIYFWIFRYLTTQEALVIFGKKVDD